jgi:hypothetical protein
MASTELDRNALDVLFFEKAVERQGVKHGGIPSKQRRNCPVRD